MNNDLISRSALLHVLEHGDLPAHFDGAETVEWMIRQIIEFAPAASADPVRLRADVTVLDVEKGWYQKSFYCRCGQLIKTEMWNEKYCFGSGTVLKSNAIPNYCPNCGAKMDGEIECSDG